MWLNATLPTHRMQKRCFSDSSAAISRSSLVFSRYAQWQEWIAQIDIFTARSELRKVLFLAPSVCFFVEISREPLNEFAPNSHGWRVRSLARTSLKVKVRGQRSRSPGTTKRHFRPFQRAACGLCLAYSVILGFVYDLYVITSVVCLNMPAVWLTNKGYQYVPLSVTTHCDAHAMCVFFTANGCYWRLERQHSRSDQGG